ncbi:GNAT family N-acetyltransferase [Marinivivus vitaminiproducens]|uniref:GNAT family N-acetyltransferase n=1 Tax=Marinivivus vitaminiproducens TaxID=3035935 RepID=UPI0027A44977|nr:GNAT family N-acetyltransferase [Geminicoccaceae bacterium SCSIO 64248]
MTVVRRALPGDASGLLHLIGQLSAHHGDIATIGLAELERDVFTAEPWATALVAEVDDVLAGYAILYRLYRAQYGQRGMNLHHLYVEPARRGSGIGRLIVEAARREAEAAGCAYMRVQTEPENLAAQRFYRAVGFTPSDTASAKLRLDLTGTTAQRPDVSPPGRTTTLR